MSLRSSHSHRNPSSTGILVRYHVIFSIVEISNLKELNCMEIRNSFWMPYLKTLKIQLVQIAKHTPARPHAISELKSWVLKSTWWLSRNFYLEIPRVADDWPGQISWFFSTGQLVGFVEFQKKILYIIFVKKVHL